MEVTDLVGNVLHVGDKVAVFRYNGVGICRIMSIKMGVGLTLLNLFDPSTDTTFSRDRLKVIRVPKRTKYTWTAREQFQQRASDPHKIMHGI